MHYEVPLGLCDLEVSVVAHIPGLGISVLEVSAFTPGTILIVAISINVHQLVLHAWVPCPHQVVEEYTGLDQELHSVHIMRHGRQEHRST